MDIINNGNDPYGSLISKFFTSEFPQANVQNKELTLEYVTDALISSNQVRYGPVPSPEALVYIRSVIRKSIEKQQPIPVLVPYGSRKAVLGEIIDIAEVSSLKTLACLNARVKERYQPGLVMNLRIEDVSGNYIFTDNADQSRYDTNLYCRSLISLIHILGYNSFINPKLESSMMNEDDFTAVADSIVPLISDYITVTDAYGYDSDMAVFKVNVLKEHGFDGGIPKEQRDYYRSRYMAWDSSMTIDKANNMLSRYLAGAWARRKLNGSGISSDWNEYIRLTFEASVPGSPSNLYSKDIVYRTIPTKFGSTNIRPWRAKGFMQLNGYNAVPKLASWHDDNDYHKNTITFSDSQNQVIVQSDYVLR